MVRLPRPLRFAPAGALIVLLALVHALGVLPLAPLTRLDHLLYDTQLRHFAPTGADSRIAMVEIDEAALAAHGRWPWRRALLAELLERIVRDGGAHLVGLDIVLTEAEQDAGLAALDALARGPLGQTADGRQAIAAARDRLDDDAALADALHRLPVVMAFHLSPDAGAGRAGTLPSPLLSAAALGHHLDALPDWPGHAGNLARLAAADTLGAGHLNGQIDDDGVLRRLPLLLRHDQAVYGALSLMMARWWLGDTARSPAALGLLPSEPPLRALRLASTGGDARTVPVDALGVALLPYRAEPGAFARVSAGDVLAGRVAPGALAGKAVLVGVAAPGLFDQRHTPVSGALPGTLLHAHMLSGLLDGRVPAQPRHAGAWQAGLLVALALGMAWSLPHLTLRRAALLAAALVLAVLAGSAMAWNGLQRTLPLGAAVLLPPALLLLHTALAYRRAIGARLRLKRLFGQYVPPELVDEMARQPEAHTMASRQAELTVLFADVRGFTGLAERMPPAELSAMMNLLFSHLTDIVRAHRGTLDKYIGDCVMAFWGAPLDDSRHAAHAVDAALAMRATLPALQAELAARGWPALDLSIGVDTGPVVVGDMGSRHRLAYTVLGDTVNRAARLQALAGSSALGLVIGQATQAAQGDRLCVPLGEVQVKGRHGRLGVWLPLDARAGERPALDARVALWRRWRDARADGRSDEAERLLQALEAAEPGDPVCVWQRRQLGAGTASR